MCVLDSMVFLDNGLVEGNLNAYSSVRYQMSIPLQLFRMVALGAALVVSACAAIPDLPPPAAPLPVERIAADQTLTGTASASWPQAGEWMGQADPQLSELVSEGIANSPDIAAVDARLRRTAALAQSVGAARQPSLGIEASATLDKSSYNNGLPKAFLPLGWNDYGTLKAALGWDLDLWGRNRAALAAARSEERAAIFEAQQARLTLITAITLAYSDFDRLFAEEEVRESELEMREAGENLVARRVEAGIDMRASLRHSQAQTATARAELAAAREALALRRHQIAALVGAGPDRGLALTRPMWPHPSVRPLPRDVTTNLVARRPDIAMARERLEAAASRVKVARTGFFPDIRLDALFGIQSLGLASLLERDSTFGSAGPALNLPLFRGSSLTGNFRSAHASLDEAVAGYNRTVLAAYQEVADAVTSRGGIAQRLEEARAIRTANDDAHALALLRYDAGLTNYLEVLAAEERRLHARLAVHRLEADARASNITLVRALGGGFVTSDTPRPATFP